MTDHTPGPWYDVAFYGNHSIGSVDVRVAEVVRDGVDDVEGEANARLIAAAPDLLDALRNALDTIEIGQRIRDPKWDGSAAPHSTIGMARAAIAKATGGP